MTRIWLVNWHFQSKITLWCTHKSTNVSMGLCWQMPKIIVWRLWSIYFDHHLSLKPFIGKRRKQSCTPNNLSNKHILLSQILFSQNFWNNSSMKFRSNNYRKKFNSFLNRQIQNFFIEKMSVKEYHVRY